MPEPLISVVSPVRNGASLVGGLLDALARQSLGANRFETVVVDDASTDATPALLRAWEAADPQQRRVLVGTGRGPAAARNLGIAAARAPWVAFTDADVVPDERWLEQLLAAGDEAAAVEGRVVPWPEEDIQVDSHYVRNENGGLYVTANMAYRRDVLATVDGFDETFRDAFLEDSDLAFRVLDRGARIVFAPDALVRHRIVQGDPRRTLRSARKLQWLPLLAAKHPQRYRAQLRPVVKPLTRPDVHVLAGLAGVALLATPGAGRLAGALLAANGARVVARDPRVGVANRDLPLQLAVAIALPPAKAAAWAKGTIRFRLRRR